jgi:hypothetical protein
MHVSYCFLPFFYTDKNFGTRMLDENPITTYCKTINSSSLMYIIKKEIAAGYITVTGTEFTVNK